MSEEIAVVSGKLDGNGVYVDDAEAMAQLEERGFGDKSDKRLYLKDYEALFLMYASKMNVLKGKSQIQMDNLVEFALNRDPDAWTKFLIYRDLRSRGYVAKEGFGFGVDFRVYGRGEFGDKAAKYVVFGLDQGREIQVQKMWDFVDQISRMRKESIVAVIESRGEVIYYRLARARLESLKADLNSA